MKKIFVPAISLIINLITLTGCDVNINKAQLKQNAVPTASAAPAQNYINTDIDEDTKGNSYISIFYTVSGLTSEAGEELNIALKKDSDNKDSISSLTLTHRENTKIEQIDLKDTEKIGKILNTLKALKVTNDNDRNAVNMAISLLNEIK